MNKQLRIFDNLRILIERGEVALFGKLVCDCECEHFYVFHSGKQTKGILTLTNIFSIFCKIIIFLGKQRFLWILLH